METQPICPSCRKTLPPGTPLGLCPECLIKSGFNTGTDPATAAAEKPRFVPPRVEELAPHFPQLEIIALIGQGGMGAVYKARQPALDRFVALKILPPGSADDAGFAERFNREARALARLNHPHIVAVHDFGQAGGQPYLVMEYVDGANLRQVEQAGRLSPEQALQIVPQICEALQFAHNEGIVHRDIKPENILIDKKGRVKITDFGIAKILGVSSGKASLTGAKDVVGTPHYMAPEQVEHPQTVDHRADIYSLGVVFYEMLTGELPLGKFAAPSKKVHVDVRLDEVVLRTLEKEPELRYQQASEVKTQVETIATSPSSSGRESAPSGAQSSLATTRYNPWELAITVGGTALLLSVLFLAAPNLRGPIAAFVILMCIFGLGICALTFAGLWPFPSPLFPQPNFASRNLRGRKTTRSSQATEPRFSRTAIVGAVWAVLFFMGLTILAVLMIPHPVTSSPPSGTGAGVQRVISARFVFIFSPILLVMLAAPFGATILGWTAVSQIRRSTGRLYGLGLAVFDGLLFPLLALDAFIFGVLHALTGDVFQGDYLAIALLVSFVFDWRIAWWVWRAVNKSTGALPASPGTPPAVSQPQNVWGSVAATVSLHALALLVGVAFFVFVVPQFAEKYANWGTSLPKGTHIAITLHFSKFVRNGGYLLLPVLSVLLAVDLAISFLLRRFAGRKLLWVWGYVALVVLVVPVAVGLWGLFAPLTRVTAQRGSKPTQTSSGPKAATLPGELRGLPTAELIQVGLADPKSTSAWLELDRRARGHVEAEQQARVLGQRITTTDWGLRKEDARMILEELTAWMRRKYPEGYKDPLYSLHGLLDTLSKGGFIGDTNMWEFLQAFHGSPRCEPLPLIRENHPTLDLICWWRNPWHDEVFGMKLVNDVRSITVDGQAVKWRNLTPDCYERAFNGHVELPALTPGKHLVKCEIQSLFLAEKDAIGVAPNASWKDWPSGWRSWRRVCQAELTVEKAEIVRLARDPALKPALSAKYVIIRPAGDRAVAVVVLNVDHTLPVNVSFDAKLRVGGETYGCGNFWSDTNGHRGFCLQSGSIFQLTTSFIDRVDPQVREAELILRPNPQAVATQASIDRIWGQEIVLSHVPLVREDLISLRPMRFGPVIKRTIMPVQSRTNCFLDLETGNLLTPPPSVLVAFARTGGINDRSALMSLRTSTAVQAWLRASGADVMASRTEATLHGRNGVAVRSGLTLFGGLAAHRDFSIPLPTFDHVTPEEQQRRVALRAMAITNEIRSGDSPFLFLGYEFLQKGGVLLFRTREGACGALEHLGEDRKSGGVKIRYKLAQSKVDASRPKRQRFEPKEGIANETSWTVLPKPSALNPDGWAAMAHVSVGGVVPVLLPDEKEMRCRITLVEGDDDHLTLRIEDSKGKKTLTVSLKRDEPAEIFVNGEGYRVLYPSVKVAADQPDTTPFAQVVVTPANEQANGSPSASKPKATADQVIVEDLALQMLTAIRDKHDATLKSLATDSVKPGWRDALLQFASEMRERFVQLTGKSFAMYPAESLVEGDHAVVKCTGPKELGGTYLVLFFVKTGDGWRNWSWRNSPPGTPLKEHLRQKPSAARTQGK